MASRQKVPGSREYRIERRLPKQPRLRVPLARMVGGNQRDRRKGPTAAMVELRSGRRDVVAQGPPSPQEAGELRAGRLVLRRGTPDGRDDVAVAQRESVVPRYRRGLVREPGPVERAIQPLAAAVSRERAPRPIPTVGGRREPDDEHPRRRIAEAGHGASPVRPVEERGALRAGNGLAVADEPRTLAARDDLGGQSLEAVGTHRPPDSDRREKVRVAQTAKARDALRPARRRHAARRPHRPLLAPRRSLGADQPAHPDVPRVPAAGLHAVDDAGGARLLRRILVPHQPHGHPRRCAVPLRARREAARGRAPRDVRRPGPRARPPRARGQRGDPAETPDGGAPLRSESRSARGRDPPADGVVGATSRRVGVSLQESRADRSGREPTRRVGRGYRRDRHGEHRSSGRCDVPRAPRPPPGGRVDHRERGEPRGPPIVDVPAARFAAPPRRGVRFSDPSRRADRLIVREQRALGPERSSGPVMSRRDRVVIAIVLAAVLATVGGLGLVWWWISQPGTGPGPGNPAVRLVPVQTGLAWPIALAFASDGRVFYAERNTGSIRIIENGAVLPTPFFTLPNTATAGERGLLGLALDPGFPGAPRVYAYQTYVDAANTSTYNRIVRIQASGNAGVSSSVIFRMPALSGATNP